MDRVAQKYRVLKYIQDFGSISTFEAFTELGITRLSARIFELKELGYRFKKKTIQTKNRYGDATHYVEYRLAEETE